LGLENLRVLAPKEQVLKKLVVFVPKENQATFSQALFAAGAGNIGNYSECSFASEGVGTFRPNESAQPAIGNADTTSSVQEVKLEFIVGKHQLNNVLNAMRANHPYEEIAFDVIDLANSHPYEGAGMIGELPQPIDTQKFLMELKQTFNCGTIRHTEIMEQKVQRVAFCGGSGSFLLQNALREKADIYITGDFKYHEFFDADNQIVIADIGHYESEQFTIKLLSDVLTEKFPNFAVQLT